MNCPACQHPMDPESVGSLTVDFCRNGCKGLWFDWGELKQLQHDPGALDSALQEALVSPRVADTNRGTLRCPQCGIQMHRHIFPRTKGISVDECYGCGGFFLDSGELKAIVDGGMNATTWQGYTQELVQGVPDFRDASQNFERRQQRANAVRAMVGLFSRQKF